MGGSLSPWVEDGGEVSTCFVYPAGREETPPKKAATIDFRIASTIWFSTGAQVFTVKITGLGLVGFQNWPSFCSGIFEWAYLMDTLAYIILTFQTLFGTSLSQKDHHSVDRASRRWEPSAACAGEVHTETRGGVRVEPGPSLGLRACQRG